MSHRARTSSPQVPPQELVSLYRAALAQGVTLEALEEKIARFSTRSQVTAQIEAQDDKHKVESLKRKLPLVVRLGALALPLVFVSVGLFLLGSALIPIASSYVSTLPMQSSTLKSPIPPEEVLDITPFIVAQAQSESTGRRQEPVILDTPLDFTNLSNWFSEDELKGDKLTKREEEYTLDIPKLNIKNAKVGIGGTDLDKSLIQYPGTAEPGQFGAPVIFGHSVLPQFYNPSEKNPRRYNSIFTTIPTLKNGDEVFITHEGVQYKYVIRSRSVVKPTDVHILSQQYDARQLKLVTCWPLGTYAERIVMTAELVAQ